MRILIVTQYFWPENFRINDLAQGLVKKGHQVTVLTGIPNYPGGSFFPGYNFFKNTRQDYNGVRIIRVPLIARGRSKGLRLLLNYFSFVFSAGILSPFYCREKYDLIFVFEVSPLTVALPAVLLRKLKGIPLILWVLDLWPESLTAAGGITNKQILWCAEKLVRFIYSKCDSVLVASPGFIPSIEAMGVKPENIRFFPNWIEEIYQSSPLDNNISKHIDVPVGFCIMFAGNIGASQDFATILSAAEKLKSYSDIHWLIVGDGRMLEWVKDQVRLRRLTDKVHLLGRHPPEAMPQFYALADVMLVTLKKDPIFSLTIPGKIQSYLASGKPIIAVLDGEGGKLIEASGSGVSCPAEDVEALSKAVLLMYKLSKDQREKMGLCGKIYCEKDFGRKNLLNKLEKWMTELTQ